MESVQTIKEWHQETFPLADLLSQRERVWLEIEEYLDSVSPVESLSELADVYIAWIGLLRFNPDAKHSKIIYQLVSQSFSIKDFYFAIEEKMKVNRQRAIDGYWVFEEETQQYVAKTKIKHN